MNLLLNLLGHTFAIILILVGIISAYIIFLPLGLILELYFWRRILFPYPRSVVK